ncbi:MAG: shikimate dehydrogenase [bacterium]|nr:shikimate dehydrogenase [bacterium]
MSVLNTQLNIVIGYPLIHTKSPVLHGLIYEEIGARAILLPFSEPDIKKLVAAIRTLSIKLTAVTMPFKQSAVNLMDSVDRSARQIGAINTIINRNGKLVGYNTDIFGMEYALRHTKLKDKHVLLLGAGGAALALAHVVKSHGGRLIYVNRTSKHIKELQKKFGGRAASMSELTSNDIDVIVNATPVGMFPDIKNSPVPQTLLAKHQTVFDLVYNPSETALLKSAKKKGATVISGINMFTAQGVRQVELWTRKKIITPKLIARLNKKIINTML